MTPQLDKVCPHLSDSFVKLALRILRNAEDWFPTDQAILAEGASHLSARSDLPGLEPLLEVLPGWRMEETHRRQDTDDNEKVHP